MSEITPQDLINQALEGARERYFRTEKANPNNLSFWFPKVKDCGFRVPETIVIPVPDPVVEAFFQEEPGDKERIRAFIHETVIPEVRKMKGLPFIKNGCYSGKFNFKHCCPADIEEETIMDCVSTIQYESLCRFTSGVTEIVLRERIPAEEHAGTIYGGMPLQTEFRVFYDFDRLVPLYCVNYWDRDYCRDAIHRNPDDGKKYDILYPHILGEYQRKVPFLITEILQKLPRVTGLTGLWSVDFLLDKDGTFWLIDMAVAQQSAYWDPYKVGVLALLKKTCEWLEGKGTRTETLKSLAYRYTTGLDADGEFNASLRLAVSDAWCAAKDGGRKGSGRSVRRFIVENLPEEHFHLLREHDDLLRQALDESIENWTDNPFRDEIRAKRNMAFLLSLENMLSKNTK